MSINFSFLLVPRIAGFLLSHYSSLLLPEMHCTSRNWSCFLLALAAEVSQSQTGGYLLPVYSSLQWVISNPILSLAPSYLFLPCFPFLTFSPQLFLKDEAASILQLTFWTKHQKRHWEQRNMSFNDISESRWKHLIFCRWRQKLQEKER